MAFEIVTNILDKYSLLIDDAVESFEFLEPYIAHPFPLQRNFVGRKTELAMLNNWFKHEPPVFSVISISGMGKTSLVWYWLHNELPQSGEKPAGVIWWSFRERHGGFDNFLNQALRYAGNGKIEPLKIASPRERMECLYGLLAKRRFLLVLDGLEMLLQAYTGLAAPYRGDDIAKDRLEEYRTCPDPNLADFLRNLANDFTRTKTLITSRLFPRELDRRPGCNRYHLRRFSLDNAIDLFYNEKVKGPKEDIKAAAAPLGYHPLSLKLFCALIKEDPEYKGALESYHKIDFIEKGPRSDWKIPDKLTHLLEHIYRRLPRNEQLLLGRLAAARAPLSGEGLKVFRDGAGEDSLFATLTKLKKRGLVYTVSGSDRYGLHPSIQKFAYDKLEDKEETHKKLLAYFESLPLPQSRRCITDFGLEIERFHHTIGSGQYDRAADIFNDRLAPLYFVFNAYLTCIDLLSAFFPRGELHPPGFVGESPQGWARDALALCYSSCGQPNRSIPLMIQAGKIYENRQNRRRTTLILGNLAQDEIALGELYAAEGHLQYCLQLCGELKSELMESVAHQDLGLLLAYKGDFEGAERELKLSNEYCKKTGDEQGLCLDESHRALAALFRGDYQAALQAARRARKFAAKGVVTERELVRTEWLLGAAWRGAGRPEEAEKQLIEALSDCHRINMVELTAPILLEIARVWYDKIMNSLRQTLEDAVGDAVPRHEILKQALSPAENLAREALEIAARCNYRLQQGEIHIFLAQLALDTQDTFLARREAEKTAKLASCGFQPLYEKAKGFIRQIA